MPCGRVSGSLHKKAVTETEWADSKLEKEPEIKEGREGGWMEIGERT